jgi:hypothetical protein
MKLPTYSGYGTYTTKTPTFRPPSESPNSTETGNNTDKEYRDFSDSETSMLKH